MNIPNVYEFLSNSDYDPHLIKNNSFILRPYQVIPKYYLISNPNSNTLIASFSMGAGKSALGVFTLLYNLEIYRMYNFNKQFTTRDAKFFQTHNVSQNVIVVGAWQTKAQFEVELMRPVFNIIDDVKANEINKLLRSNIPEQVEEGKLKRKKIINQIDKDISFQGYQSFFNRVFPDVSAEAYNQNIDSLILEYERGNLQISPKFLASAKDNIIIVDEMQKLYSNLGLNTYGFAIACVAKVAKKWGINILFLTGTMINSSLGEIPDIINIISERPEFIKHDELCRDDIILGNIPVRRLKTSELPNIMKVFYPRFMYFNQSRGKTKEPPTLTPINEHPESLFIPPAAAELKGGQLLTFPRRKDLPQEIHIGNRVISSPDSLQPMLVYSVQAKGLQAKRFTEYIKSNLNSYANIDVEETDTMTSIHDAFIPDSSKWNEYHIFESNNTLYGRFLSLERLGEFSALGVEVCKICLQNAFEGEKVVVYHSKINNFGIRQYGIILQYNGFIKYGNAPSQTSLCKFCHHPYQLHAKPLEERLKVKCCNQFRGLYYDALIGELDQNERDNLTNNIFNNPNNLHGDIISVMFVSDVAYSGVSFLNTQNMIVITRVPNISKWKQIYARIIRTRSHALFEPEKQYSKIYTMTIEIPNETTDFPSLNGATFEERYYKIRSILNEDIDGFINKLASNCVGDVLLNHPKDYTPTKSEKLTCEALFQADLSNEIKLVITRIMNEKNTNIWSLQTLLKRIKDVSLSASFLNLSIVPDDILTNMMLKNKIIQLFQYKINNNQTIYAQFIPRIQSTVRNGFYTNLPTFEFAQLESIDLTKSNINSLLKLLETETAITNILSLLGKIIKLTKHRYELLIGRKIFWDTMFDIGNEYYEDDEQNFIHNHCRKNRNKSSVAGCYYGQQIILKNGTSKVINYSFPIVSVLPNLPYKFKISCLSFSESSPFYLHVNIIKIVETSGNDKRKESKGLVCTSMNVTELHKYFPNIDTTLHKRKYCSELLFSICERQETEKVKFCYTPFEK